ncbi:MAG: hypothetical protein RMJ36_06720 [Candidatus Calescibacterium sp.]|nr:hypothetical protein [Candidatus Calescibacterium sp.]MDW8133329.1 hypothetical protein [Candidatus Calescibacterium sp.]
MKQYYTWVIIVLLVLFNLMFILYSSAKEHITFSVITFSDAVTKSGGKYLAKYIHKKLSENYSDHTFLFDKNSTYDNLPEAINNAKSEGAEVIIGGVITKFKIGSNTVSIGFDCDVRFTSDGAIIFENSYSSSKPITKNWTWKGWEKLNIESPSFEKTPLGKALNEAIENLMFDIDEHKNKIIKVIQKNRESN